MFSEPLANHRHTKIHTNRGTLRLSIVRLGDCVAGLLSAGTAQYCLVDENPLMITPYMSAGCLYATMDTNLYFLSLVMSHPDFYSLDYDTVPRDSVVSE